jgi:hypothetical protein
LINQKKVKKILEGNWCGDKEKELDSHICGCLIVNVSIQPSETSSQGSTIVSRVRPDLIEDQHISENTHKSNALKFRVKVWCQSYLFGCSMLNVSIQLNVSSPHSLTYKLKK